MLDSYKTENYGKQSNNYLFSSKNPQSWYKEFMDWIDYALCNK